MEKEIAPHIGPTEKAWIQSLEKNDRIAGLAFVHYKHALGHDWTKLPKPELFIDAFQLGHDYCARAMSKAMASAVKEEKKNLDQSTTS